MFGGISRALSMGAKPFLLMTRTSRIVTAVDFTASTGGSTGLSSKQPDLFSELQRSSYSYGRRLPGLRFRASHLAALTPLLNLPAPGRRQTLYLLLRVGRVLCF